MKAEVITITPILAKDFLSKNTSNRLVHKGTVSLYASIMERGQWKLNGEGIVLDTNGNLLNGQHRLSAVIKCNKNIDFLVVSGVGSDSYTTFDTGKKRSAQDVFKIDGILNSSSIAGGISRYLKLLVGVNANDSSKTEAKISNQDVLDEYNLHCELYQSLFHRSASFYNLNHRILSKSDYIGYYRFFQTKYNTDVIDSFFESINNSTGICGILKDRLLSELISKRKSTTTERTALVIKSFNHFISGKDVKLLKYSITEKFPTLK